MRWWLALVALLWAGAASAQQQVVVVTPVCSNATGVQVCSYVPVLSAPKTATIAAPTACSVTTTSSQCLAAGTYNHVQIQLSLAASANVGCSWGATAYYPPAAAQPSWTFGPGQSANWGPATAGVPGGALNCVAASGTQIVTLEFN